MSRYVGRNEGRHGDTEVPSPARKDKIMISTAQESSRSGLEILLCSAIQKYVLTTRI